ncbi:MAG: helix-turn-helix transcriptional regulator [Clostridiales bacterium]|nr:helix-turn-helix transcriptional regulator [Clostridiales bacterium]
MIKIHFIGCEAKHPDNFVFHIPKGHDCWLLLHIHTPALFLVDGQLKEYPAHCAVLYQPHQKIYYRASIDQYINDWILFDSDEAYVINSKLPYGIPFPLDDPLYCHKLFQLLNTEHIFNKDFKVSSVDYLFRILFNKLHESYLHNNISPNYYNLIKLRVQIHNNPGHHWTVAEMAKQIHLSPGYLQAIYKNTFGISCMEDVINSRIRLAKEYLMQDFKSIAEIATLCGYNNIEHFCRQFKKLTGVAPGAFRAGCTKKHDR